MHPSAAANQPCLICCRPTSQWCSSCNSALYCSPEHLRKVESRHREQRRPSPAKPNMIATPPSAEPECISVSAILFLADVDCPRIITVKCRPPHHPSHGCPVPLLQPYFDAPPESVILTQDMNGELLPSPLHIFYSPIALTKGWPINCSIYHINSGAA
ncbi:hypothetical protein B0H19DRAFT_852986, partial [Mycena capillaripes]